MSRNMKKFCLLLAGLAILIGSLTAADKIYHQQQAAYSEVK